MRNVKVMTITSIYCSASQQPRERTEGRENINTEEVEKQKQRWGEAHKERN
jgi:hypothetical protein